jgi:hypothetical protein
MDTTIRTVPFVYAPDCHMRSLVTTEIGLQQIHFGAETDNPCCRLRILYPAKFPSRLHHLRNQLDIYSGTDNTYFRIQLGT